LEWLGDMLQPGAAKSSFPQHRHGIKSLHEFQTIKRFPSPIHVEFRSRYGGNRCGSGWHSPRRR
jgi:hypothetical protein